MEQTERSLRSFWISWTNRVTQLGEQNGWLERVGLGLIVFGYYGVYFILNRWLVTKGTQFYTLTLPIDRMTPLQPIWMVPYVLIFFVTWLPIVTVKDIALFRRMFWAYMMTQSISFVFFILVPVKYVLRPEAATVPIDSFFSWGIHMAYWLDQPFTCFPSLHVSMSVLAAFCTWKVNRFYGWIGLVGAFLICVSTMFVKQHYLLDVLAGIALAWFSFRLCVLSFSPRESEEPKQLSISPWLGSLPFATFGAVLFVLYIAYIQGWKPWL